jgi:predicted amidohydrolase
MIEQNRIPNCESMITLAAIQMEPRIGYKEANVRRSLEMINEGADKGAKFLVLPELCNTGYMFNSREELYAVAEKIPEGPTTQAWVKLAAKRKLYIVAGIAELAADGIRCYNSCVLIGPDGYIGTHRKLHAWCDEKVFFEAGDLGFQVFETPIGRVSMLICYDMWFFENFRILARKGADIVCCPTNWVDIPPSVTAGPVLAQTNSGCNSIFIVAADRVGVERGCHFPGRSVIMGPEGWHRAQMGSDDKEEILIAEVNLMEARRLNWNPMNVVFRDRRTDLYDDMLGSGEKPLPR